MGALHHMRIGEDQTVGSDGRYHAIRGQEEDEIETQGALGGGTAVTEPAGITSRVADAILDVVGAIPGSDEPASKTPHSHAAVLAARAARSTAAISAGAALIPGPAGLLTLLPDIVGVWKVQAQLVADIAAVYGKTATLTQEQMLYCLFRHLASQGLRDVVVRVGERILVRRASLQVLQKLAVLIGVKYTQRAIGKAIARYVPLLGAAGVAVYAFYDTRKVAATATDLFESMLVLEAADQRHTDPGKLDTVAVIALRHLDR